MIFNYNLTPSFSQPPQNELQPSTTGIAQAQSLPQNPEYLFEKLKYEFTTACQDEELGICLLVVKNGQNFVK
jgi:hypothetical protein